MLTKIGSEIFLYLIKKDMKIKLMSNNQEYIIEKVGVFTPKPNDIEILNA